MTSKHSTAAAGGRIWTFEPEGRLVRDDDGMIVVDIDADMTSDLTEDQRVALGEWIAREGPAVVHAAVVPTPAGTAA